MTVSNFCLLFTPHILPKGLSLTYSCKPLHTCRSLLLGYKLNVNNVYIIFIYSLFIIFNSLIIKVVGGFYVLFATPLTIE